MKKHCGYIRRGWEAWDAERGDWVVTEVTYQPVGPNHRAVPNACWHADDGNHLWIMREEDDEAKVEWYEAQDALDEMAAVRVPQSGGQARGKQMKAQADVVNIWLYPLLEQTYAECSSSRRGWRTLERKAKQKLPMEDPRRKKITRSRIEVWLKVR